MAMDEDRRLPDPHREWRIREEMDRRIRAHLERPIKERRQALRRRMDREAADERRREDRTE